MAASHEHVVGRVDELAALTAFLGAELPAGLVIEGDPGIGKTTLWRAALTAASQQGFVVLSCSPSGSEAELGFAALRDLIEPQYERVANALPSPQRRALDVVLLRVDAAGRAPPRATVGYGLLRILRELAGETPVLVAVDDIQWLDRESALALEFALRRLRDERVALLFALRTANELPLALERGTWLQSVTSLNVQPLALDPMHRMLVARLDTPLPRPVLRRVHEVSGGNPFFALELARTLRGRADLRVPDQLQKLVRARFTALPAATLEAVQVASALSRPTVKAVLDAADVDEPAFDAAVAADLVTLEDNAVRFSHPLLASAAYQLLTPSRRRAIHGRLARAATDAEERARHLALATVEPREDVAAAVEAGAALAQARGARATAAELFEHAARLTPDSRSTDRRRRRAEAGTLHFESGDNRRGRVLLEALAAELPHGPERARVLTRLALTRAYDDDLVAATDLLLDAAREAGRDLCTRAEALSSVASALFRRRERLAEAVGHAETAASIARELRDVQLLADALGNQLLAEAALGGAEAQGTLERLLDLRKDTSRIRVLSSPAWIAGIVRMWWEDVEWAADAFAETLELGRGAGEDALLPYVYVLIAQNECLRARFDDAADAATAGYELAEQAGEWTLGSYALALLALVDAHRGRVDEAREAGRRALEIAQATGGRPTLFFAAWALGLLELSLGDAAAAVEQLHPIVELATRESIREPGMTRFFVDYAEALIELGRPGEAKEIAEQYGDVAEARARRGALGAALRCRALVAAAEGDTKDALSLIRRARAEHEAAPLPFERARTVLVEGTTLRRLRQRAAARATLLEAKQQFAELGAARWVERAEQELARIGGRARAEDALTPTEVRVAELVAEGASTKEVAATLFVSPKTVEGHLSKIYAKLGVRSRTELAHRFTSVS